MWCCFCRGVALKCYLYFYFHHNFPKAKLMLKTVVSVQKPPQRLFREFQCVRVLLWVEVSQVLWCLLLFIISFWRAKFALFFPFSLIPPLSHQMCSWHQAFLWNTVSWCFQRCILSTLMEGGNVVIVLLIEMITKKQIFFSGCGELKW